MTLSQIALAFVNQQDCATSNIIGATNLDQLKENIDAFEISLPKDIVAELEQIPNLVP